MSAPYIIPFNFQPINLVTGTTASYTVPAGKYAIVKINMSCAASASSPNSGGAGVAGCSVIPSATNKYFELILRAGDVLTSTLTNASGTLVSTANNSISGTAETVATVLVNSVIISTCKATVGATANTGAATTITYAGTSHVGYVSAEYNIIS